jgi:hypothetical protein
MFLATTEASPTSGPAPPLALIPASVNKKNLLFRVATELSDRHHLLPSLIWHSGLILFMPNQTYPIPAHSASQSPTNRPLPLVPTARTLARAHGQTRSEDMRLAPR